jgi:hypothetical protein
VAALLRLRLRMGRNVINRALQIFEDMGTDMIEEGRGMRKQLRCVSN